MDGDSDAYEKVSPVRFSSIVRTVCARCEIFSVSALYIGRTHANDASSMVRKIKIYKPRITDFLLMQPPNPQSEITDVIISEYRKKCRRFL